MRRCDVELATPRCWRKIVPKKGGWHTTCHKLMRYRHADNTWVCDCGHEVCGWAIAARSATMEAAA